MTQIAELTDEQRDRIPAYVKHWIDVGLRTGDADFKTFDRYMPICYAKAGIPYPCNVVRVKSPIVGAFAAAIANRILNGAAVGTKVSASVRDAVGSAVDAEVGAEVSASVRDAVGSAVSAAVGAEVGVEVSAAVSTAVGSAVDAEVGAEVGIAIGKAIDAAVSIKVNEADKKGFLIENLDLFKKYKIKKLKWHGWLGGQFWVGGWYRGNAYVSFLLDVCGLRLSDDLMERAEAYRKVNESVNYIWPNRKFVIVCDRPKKINRDESGHLHCLNGKSIEYGDGWGLYHLWGIRFTDKEWKRWRYADGKEVMKIPNADQRAAVIKAQGGEKIVADCGGKTVASDEYGELIELESILDGNGRPYRFLKAFDPSHGQYVYLRCHPDCKTPTEAEAKSYRLDRYNPIIRT